MALQRYEYEELVLLRILNLTSLLPHYWSELFLLAKQLLNDEEERKLYEMIRSVEKMVLEEEHWHNIFRCDDCGHSWQTESDWFEYEQCQNPECRSSSIKLVRERQSLYDIEMALESNRDFTAYFERYGKPISKFDVERRLDKIKEWLFQIVKVKAQSRRFKRFA